MKAKLNTIKSKLRITRDPAVNALEYTWPALKLALTALEKTLDGVPIPGLKGAIGGFLELAKTAEVSARTTDWAASRRDCSRLSRHRSRTRRISSISRRISRSSLAFFNGGLEHANSLQSSK